MMAKSARPSRTTRSAVSASEIQPVSMSRALSPSASLTAALGGGVLRLGHAGGWGHQLEAALHSRRDVEGVDARVREGPAQLDVGTEVDAVPELLSADALGETYHAEMAYENPDGTNIVFDTDFFGKKRPAGNVTPGPFEVMGVEALDCEFEL